MQHDLTKPNQIIVNKHLPHNFLAEKILLSCLLINSEAIESTSRIIPIEAFYFQNHQEIYRAIIFMQKNQIPIDILTLITFLQDNGLLNKIGGIKVLIELVSQIPNLIYFEEYLSLVKDKFIRRSLIKLGYETINSGYITNIPLEKTLNELENKLFNVTHKSTNQKLLNSAELLNTIFFDLKAKFLNPTLSNLPSGFYDLDSLIQGFQKSDLIILAGRPSMGKTAFGLNIVLNIVKSSKRPILFFSLEMSKEQIIYRLLAMEANINQMRLKSAKLYQTDWIKLNKIIKILSKLPFFIDDSFQLSIQDIRSKIKAIIFEQNDIALIIIDYLQLMKSSKSNVQNRTQELSEITRSLKTLAREFNIPIIALSQLNRNLETRINKRPLLSDLRESGSIEQDADLVLMLNRISNSNSTLSQDQSTSLIELIVAKQRNGPIGTVKLKFDEKRAKFFNINR